jgi:hypothetical protein
MADNDSTEAVAVATIVEPAPPAAAAPEAKPASKTPTCKTCKGTLVVYAGANPFKLNTGFCEKCGERRPL